MTDVFIYMTEKGIIWHYPFDAETQNIFSVKSVLFLITHDAGLSYLQIFAIASAGGI